jgi:mRNA-degrading endonuclease HigB of HigAB toxin-antitoxin module
VENKMHVITRKRLNDFAAVYPETKTALQHWYQTLSTGQISNKDKSVLDNFTDNYIPMQNPFGI